MDSLPVDSTEKTPMVAGDAETACRDIEPYHAFTLPGTDREMIPPFQALIASPEAAGYLSGGGENAWSPARIRRACIRLFVFLLILVPLLVLPDWRMFERYAPPPPADTPKPSPYLGVAPQAFRDRIRDVNDDIRAGNRWRPAFDKLYALFRDVDALPTDLRIWVNSELLVTLASKEISPDWYEETLPDRVFADLRDAAGDAALPFRAAAAYATILHARPAAAEKDKKLAPQLLAILDGIRNDHPGLMDGNGDLLSVEAHEHIAALPVEYTPGDRRIEYHWRRAAYAIERLYALSGGKDASVRGLDRKRWEAAYRFFDFTVLTLDMDRLGRLKSVKLDGRDYSRDDIKTILEQL